MVAKKRGVKKGESYGLLSYWLCQGTVSQAFLDNKKHPSMLRDVYLFSVLLFLLCIASGLHSRALLHSPFSQSVSVSLSSYSQVP